MPVFVDTNVFFYAHDDRFPDKQRTSRVWIGYLSERGSLKTNLQVANEFVHVASRRLPKLPKTTLFAMADNILSCGSTSVSVNIHMRARKVRDRTGYAW